MYYFFRRHLHFTVEEVDAMPHVEQRMYMDGLLEEFQGSSDDETHYPSDDGHTEVEEDGELVTVSSNLLDYVAQKPEEAPPEPTGTSDLSDLQGWLEVHTT